MNKCFALKDTAIAQAQDGDIPVALNTANLINDPLYKSQALIYIAKAQAQDGDSRGAESTLQEALNTANLITNPYWESVALRYIAQAQEETGDISQALETASGINDPLCKREALIDIALKYIERKKEVK
jgi:hypothetical protein